MMISDRDSGLRMVHDAGLVITALKTQVLAAPAAIREALFEIEAGAVRALRDNKAILRAERAPRAA